MITIKERDRIVDALFREFNRGGAMPNTWAIFKRMRALIISMSQYTGVHDHTCPCEEEWLSTTRIEKDITKRRIAEWVNYMNKEHPCPIGDHRVPPMLIDWLNKRED